MSISKYKRNSLKPFLKWPGGKSKELKYIIPSLPKVIQNYYEPFVGGGAVYFSIDRAEKYYINDKSEDLIDLYHSVADHGNRDFINSLLNIDKSWSDIEKVFDSFKEDLIATYESYRKDINKISYGNRSFNIQIKYIYLDNICWILCCLECYSISTYTINVCY